MLNPEIAPFEAGGQRYRITGKLNAIQQLHIVRRLAPLVSAFAGVDLAALRPEEQALDPERGTAAMQQLLGPLAEGVAKLSDGDTEYVLAACMTLVQRDLGGGAGWGPVWNPQAKAMQYDDVGFVELMQIVGRVLLANMGDFGSALRPTGGASAAVLPT